ncbi:cytochrome P450 [Polyporus arcularius HHB13444]|uniref:Cytochrome P450 n=1 Tax=Polyporus arcularius HHB13444 TaxID=1314778 RepID=A0A5C3NYZ9_9APHY|nr:cytochrome P450 [Polyporus arcularius HHB13444]
MGIAPTAILLVAFLVLSYTVSLVKWRRRSRGHPLPPGPRGLPYIGNIVHMRKPELWKAHKELCKKYGDVVYVPVLGQDVVVLGSPQAIFDLLDRKSAVTSDRQQNPTIPLSGHDFNVAFMPYGQWWRRHRQVFTRHFLPITSEHLAIQRSSGLLFLRKMLNDPQNLIEHIRYTFSASIVKTTYGVDVAPDNDKNVALMEKVLQSVQAFAPGRFLVQYFPILSHVPTWFPVAGPQLLELAPWRAAARQVKQAMFEKTKEDIERGRASKAVLPDILEKLSEKAGSDTTEDQEIAKNVCITAFVGGSDTTFSTLEFFFLAMSLNPDIQKKAQAELHSVVGPNRLPYHADKDSLPYVSAIVKEALRWQNVAPFSIPHYTSEDLEYRGWFIPKGTVLVPNTWAVMHDEAEYPEPDRFLPERFLKDGKLNPDIRDPSDFIFGYGRRICPGKSFGEASLFISIAMILHVFDITPPVDEHGNIIRIEPKIAGSFIIYPEDCRCNVKPRSAKATALILGAQD